MGYIVKHTGLAPPELAGWARQARAAAETAWARNRLLAAGRLLAPFPRLPGRTAGAGWRAFEPRRSSRKKKLQRAADARSWNKVFALKDTS